LEDVVKFSFLITQQPVSAKHGQRSSAGFVFVSADDKPAALR
jgi:hypothetical protein